MLNLKDNNLVFYFIKQKKRKQKKKVFFLNKFIFINRRNFLLTNKKILQKKNLRNDNLFYFLGFRFLTSIYLKQIFYVMYGLNYKYFVRLIMCLFGCFFNIKLNLLNLDMLYPCQLKLKNTFLNYDLQKKIKSMIDRLKKLQLYQGYRHGIRLSVRGQRTKTNSQIQKKKRK